MSRPDEPLGLAQLDHAPALTLDPSVLSGNLAALRRSTPLTADVIESARLPETWRAISGLDGSPTFRTEPAGAPPAWLGGTAAPQTRADALLGATDFGEQNVALPGAGTGAELRILGRRLAAFQSIFWFAGAADARAILALYDFADLIERRRLWLVTEESIEAALREILLHHPGLVPPATIVNLPDVPFERLELVRRQCDAAARYALAARNERLIALRAAWNAPHPVGAIRLACVALGGDERRHALAREISAAAARCGLPSAAFALDSPLAAHPLALGEILAGLQPTHILRCDAETRPLPVRAEHAALLRFCFSPVPPITPASGERPLAGSPHMRRSLRDAGFRDAEIADFFWAVAPLESECDAPRRGVALLGDLPDSSAAACGIDQATHLTLWERLNRILTERWEHEDMLRPAMLLQAAERELGFGLRETDLRERLLRLIEYVMTPAVILRRLHAAAREEVIPIGRGWSAVEAARSHASVKEAVSAGFRPIAAITTVLPLGATGDVLAAAEAEWPILLHLPPRAKAAHWLGDVLDGERHVRAFSSERELLRGLELASAGDASLRAMASAARRHVATRHTWDARLRDWMPRMAEARE